MTSSPRGGRRTRISPVEVAHISKHGFWLLIENKERFVPFKEFHFSGTRRSASF
jgi:hypothetical protein